MPRLVSPFKNPYWPYLLTGTVKGSLSFIEADSMGSKFSGDVVSLADFGVNSGKIVNHANDFGPLVLLTSWGYGSGAARTCGKCRVFRCHIWAYWNAKVAPQYYQSCLRIWRSPYTRAYPSPPCRIIYLCGLNSVQGIRISQWETAWTAADTQSVSYPPTF